MRDNHQNGAALITMALLFALVGILLGLGRLKAYEFQVSRRISRQYQIDKMLVTRSALTLIKHECAPDGSDAGLPSYTTTNSLGTLTCDIAPIPILALNNWDTCCLSNGIVVTENATVITNVIARHGTEATFAVATVATNVLYTSALFKKAERFWMESAFGYVYRLQLAPYGTGFDKLRLYLVGMETGVELTSATYVGLMASCPSIMMELSLENGTPRALRTLRINNGKVPFPDAPILTGDAQLADSITNGGGFLLSATAVVGFGERAAPPQCVANKEYADLIFSPNRVDLSPLFDINSFSNAWIVIENQFAITNQADQSYAVSVSPFIMREPQTYAISVHANAITNNLDRGLMTWVFQTEYPILGSRLGRQCVLDTFGVEPTSFSNERRGLWPGE